MRRPYHVVHAMIFTIILLHYCRFESVRTTCYEMIVLNFLRMMLWEEYITPKVKQIIKWVLGKT